MGRGGRAAQENGSGAIDKRKMWDYFTVSRRILVYNPKNLDYFATTSSKQGPRLKIKQFFAFMIPLFVCLTANSTIYWAYQPRLPFFAAAAKIKQLCPMAKLRVDPPLFLIPLQAFQSTFDTADCGSRSKSSRANPWRAFRRCAAVGRTYLAAGTGECFGAPLSSFACFWITPYTEKLYCTSRDAPSSAPSCTLTSSRHFSRGTTSTTALISMDEKST